jgi:hypothetical protein
LGHRVEIRQTQDNAGIGSELRGQPLGRKRTAAIDKDPVATYLDQCEAIVALSWEEANAASDRRDLKALPYFLSQVL